MRRPRVPSASTPSSGTGESSQKTSRPPYGRSHTINKRTEGSHETRAYKVGRKHPTEAYGG